MVDRSYLVAKPPPPSSLKTTFDQVCIPAMIDAAGTVEGLIERVSVRVRQAPLIGVTVALACGAILAAGLRSRPAK